MSEVRFGVVGLGNIGLRHANCLREGKVPGARLTAVCSSKPSSLPSADSLAMFTEPKRLVRSGVVDAVVIATPHPAHLGPTLLALEAACTCWWRNPSLRINGRRSSWSVRIGVATVRCSG